MLSEPAVLSFVVSMAGRLDSSSEELVNDDEISLSSSGSEEQEEYTVEGILAERLLDDSSPRYLVKWENYGEERWAIRNSIISLYVHSGWIIHIPTDSVISLDVLGSLPNHFLTHEVFKTGRGSGKRESSSPMMLLTE